MVDPVTRVPEKCASCDPNAVRVGLAAGGTILLFGVAGIVLLVAFSIWLLL
jgi:hypothetical protein